MEPDIGGGFISSARRLAMVTPKAHESSYVCSMAYPDGASNK